MKIKCERTLMRSAGDNMIVSIKDTIKLVGVSVISCCAVFVCAIFLNYYIDITAIEDQITSPPVMAFYNAQVSTAKVVVLVSGGCLLLTAVVMLLFYIKHYVDMHKKELGILKAMGYGSLSIAKSFWAFGLSVLTGAAVGFLGALCFMPHFYNVQNEDKILPEIAVSFQPMLAVCLVLLPAVAFALLSILYSYFKLRQPALNLISEKPQKASKQKKPHNEKSLSDRPFLSEVKVCTLKSKKSLVFFMIFSSFCFSAMTQMSFSMKDLSSPTMGAMMLIIGLVLAFTTLVLSVTTVISGNTKTIAMMRAFGYRHKECCRAILGGYRPLAYVGFAIGTVYQYALLKIMVYVVFKDIESVPEYNFDFPMMLVSLAVFAVLYELIMYCYTKRIKKISIKEIMSE